MLKGLLDEWRWADIIREGKEVAVPVPGYCDQYAIPPAIKLVLTKMEGQSKHSLDSLTNIIYI